MHPRDCLLHGHLRRLDLALLVAGLLLVVGVLGGALLAHFRVVRHAEHLNGEGVLRTHRKHALSVHLI